MRLLFSGGLRVRISTGKTYLFKERVPLRTHQVLRRELSKGRKTLYISKNAPELLRSQLNFEPDRLQTKWLSPRPDSNCIPPMNLMAFKKDIEDFIKANKDGIVVLNGVDVLEMWNGFRPVLDVLASAHDDVEDNGCNMIISLDPKNHYAKRVGKLEKMSDVIISS
jgi:hypothetical protein